MSGNRFLHQEFIHDHNHESHPFDRDVPYVAMMMNADGAVDGRYGTRTSKDRTHLRRQNLSSFQRSLERSLDLHRNYPNNAAQLAGIRRPAKSPPMAEDMPTFEPFPEKYNYRVKDCIHCHTVGEATLRERISDGPLSLRDVWPYPPAITIGLTIDVMDGLKTEGVAPDSPAAKADVQAGDVLLSLNHQPLVSEADIQWALHDAPDNGIIPATARRGGKTGDTELTLTDEWRKSRIRWRTTMEVLRPDIVMDSHQKGLRSHYPRGKARRAGLRGNEIVVAVDGHNMRTEAEFLKYLYIDEPLKRSVELTIERNGHLHTVTLPVRLAIDNHRPFPKGREIDECRMKNGDVCSPPR